MRLEITAAIIALGKIAVCAEIRVNPTGMLHTTGMIK
jgi:hypothetical protein